MLSKAHKTRVSKYGHIWRIDYYLPFSGFLLTYEPTWQDAMNEAWDIEKQRIWS